MTSWNSLPYELKLHIGKNFIDILIVEVPAFSPGHLVGTFGFSKAAEIFTHCVWNEYVPASKQQIRSFMVVAPQLQQDLAAYCTTRYKHGGVLYRPQAPTEEQLRNWVQRCVALSLGQVAVAM